MGIRKIVAKDEATFTCSKEKVFQALVNLETYSTWWPCIIDFRGVQMTTHVVGSKTDVHPFWVTCFHYEIEHVEEHAEIVFRYSGPACRGVGIWRIGTDGLRCIASYEIDLIVQSRFLKLVSHGISLNWIHSMLMRWMFRNFRLFLQQKTEIGSSVHVEVVGVRGMGQK